MLMKKPPFAGGKKGAVPEGHANRDLKETAPVSVFCYSGM